MGEPVWKRAGWSSESMYLASMHADAIAENAGSDEQRRQHFLNLIELLDVMIDNPEAQQIVEGLLLHLMPQPRGRPSDLEKRLRRASSIHHQYSQLVKLGEKREEALEILADHHRLSTRSIAAEIAYYRKVFPEIASRQEPSED